MTTRNRALLADARLYLCTDGRRERGDFEAFVNAAYAGGVDVIQLREKGIEARDELELLEVLADAAARHGRLWSVNDRADIAAVSGAPVLHVGQRDLPPATARRLVHPEVIVGASTHDPEQLTTTQGNPDVDYYCVGPVWSTPTKPGRPAAGLELVRAAAATAGDKPWFAIGGIDDERLDEVLAAGATRIVVVRVITEADDPEAAAAGLTQRLRRND